MNNGKQIYLGLDVGTNSVGYAVTDQEYNLQRFRGADAWGSVIFDEASQSAERRGFRSARRRLERRKQRIRLLQEIFAEEIAKKDPRFYIRLSESYRWREETEDRYIFFNDEEYTDAQYMKDYPTIHHLICELMENKEAHDVRMVYLACAWLLAHRGHFLSQIRVEDLDKLIDIGDVYDEFIHFFRDNSYDQPWGEVSKETLRALGEILKKKAGIKTKEKELKEILLDGKKADKTGREEFPFSQESLIKLLAGGSCKPKDIFGKEEYAEYDSVSLNMDDEKATELMTNIGEDYDLIVALRKLYEWGILADVLDQSEGSGSISAAKVALYEKHKKDLQTLKYFVRKYLPEKYEEVFRQTKGKKNYAAYVYHADKGDVIEKKANVEDFSKYILGLIKEIEPEEKDAALYEEMKADIELRSFLPKQKNTDNRIIPHQLYEYELLKILENAAMYLPFLKEKDADGTTASDKIHAIFTFKIPYYVGPLNTKSEHAWISRKEGRIRPWNYSEIVDEDASEEAFIRRMTNSCSYLAGEDVLPKDSLCYQKFMVLNEINNLKIDGQKIPLEAKQGIYEELFKRKKKVRRKDIEDYLISNNYLEKEKREKLSGIDEEIHSSLSTYYSFRKLLKDKILSEKDVERIVERASYAEDKTRVKKWLRKEYPNLSEEDVNYIGRIKIKDFGRLSEKFLKRLEGCSKESGEVTCILRLLWETNDNLMELLSDRYSFAEAIQKYNEDYYEGTSSLKDILEARGVSNAVRRPIYRTLAITKDVEKAFGKPDKIFIEMTRSSRTDLKGKRTKSRYQQIIDLYSSCKEEAKEVQKQLEDLGEAASTRLQSDRLFLYFMQLGRCAYSNAPIDLKSLMSGSETYNIDHIYPQAYVKDDSIINNKVLVLSTLNGDKGDDYPIRDEIRNKMQGVWKYWHKAGLLSDEKYKRLIRSTGFTEEERYGFISRQLTETSQATKLLGELLKEKYPEAEIVYTKAGLVSDFRHVFGLLKARSYNDLHHAEDAYLNVVVGNVYDMKFSKRWFTAESSYSIKTETLFTHDVNCGGELIWDSKKMLPKVKKTAQKNSGHFVKYAFFKTGGLFDQNPVKKAAGLVPLKKGMSTEKYGGYNKAGVMFFIPTRYKAGKKNDIMVLPVELMHGRHFLEDEEFARKYAFQRLEKILGKRVEEVSFPMGMRPWKINTVLSLDGFRVCITGIGSGGKSLLAQPIMQFSSAEEWKGYIKRLERFVEKNKKNPNYKYDREYDKISREENGSLYELYIEKLQESIYKKRINSPLKTLIDGRERFEKLEIAEQSQVLLNIHSVFGRIAGGCDLTSIGGKKNSASTKSGLSTIISNWKKYYSNVRIIDQSPSGLWERKSQNLLELL